MPASGNIPVGSPKIVLPSPSLSYSGATAPYSYGSPTTPQTTNSFCSCTPTLEPLTFSAGSTAHSRNLSGSPFTPSFVRSKPCSRSVIDNATRTFHFGEAAIASPVAPQRNLRSFTKKNNAKYNHCEKQNHLLTQVSPIPPANSKKKKILPTL